VLTAFQDVENDLSGLRILADQAQALDVAVNDATPRHADRARGIRRPALSTTPPWPWPRRTSWPIQQSAIAVQQSRLIDAVSLIGDLGGGWSADQLHNP
jgi:outer membrane protein TolC